MDITTTPELRKQKIYHDGLLLNLLFKVKKTAASCGNVENSIKETARYMHFPREYWTRIRTNIPIKRILKEVRGRTRVVGAFPDGESALMLVAVCLHHISYTK